MPNQHLQRKKLKVLWLRFLRELGEKTNEVDPALLEVPEIREAIKYTQSAAYSPTELDAYKGYWKAVSNEKTLPQASKEEGRIVERIAIAKNLKAKGLPIQVIAECTNLSKDEIEVL